MRLPDPRLRGPARDAVPLGVRCERIIVSDFDMMGLDKAEVGVEAYPEFARGGSSI